MNQKLEFRLTRKLPEVERSQTGSYWFNIDLFAIVQPRDFGAAEIPIFESRSVYKDVSFL